MTVSVATPPDGRNPFAPGLLDAIAHDLRKVVVVRASRIGDFICATPALRALRRATPHAEITLVALPVVEPLAARLPYIDRFAAFPGFPGMADQFFNPRHARSFFSRMQSETFDLAIQLHGSGAYANPFTLMLGARRNAGFVRSREYHDCLDAALPMPPEGVYEPQRWLQLIAFLGGSAESGEVEFPLWEQDRCAAAALLTQRNRPYIGLHAGGRDASKRWPPDRFAAIGQALIDRYGGTLLLLGGPDDIERSRQVADRCDEVCLDLTGHLSLPTFGAVIEQLDFLLTNDSGPAHMAYALHTPSVTIFGGTEPEAWGANDDGSHALIAHPIACRPCSEGACRNDFACLYALTPDMVLPRACAILEAGANDKRPAMRAF